MAQGKVKWIRYIAFGTTVLCSVAAPGAQVALPSLAAEPGRTVEIPIAIRRSAGLAGFQLTIRFDPALAKSVRIEKGSLIAGWTAVTNTDRPGEAKIIGVDPSLHGLVGNDGTLARLVVDVAEGPVLSSDLVWAECKLRDPEARAIPAELSEGKLILPVSAEGAARDTLADGLPLCPLLGVFLAAGFFLAASRLRMTAVVLASVCLVPAAARAVTVSIPNKADVSGATVEIPINIDNATGVAGFQFTVTFNSAVLQATSVKAGTLVTGWAITPNLSVPGQIRVVGFDPTLAGLSGGSGSLVKLTFNVVGTAGQSTTFSFTECKLRDGFAGDIPAVSSGGTFIVLSSTGFLQVNLAPLTVLAAAQWRVDGGAWQTGGAVLELLAGSHSLEFKDVADWVKPDARTVQISAGQTATETGTYVAKGDLDASTVIDISDVILTMRLVVKLPVTINAQTLQDPYPAWLLGRAYINGDTEVDISDVILIMRKTVGL
jgi:hypothetical protein